MNEQPYLADIDQLGERVMNPRRMIVKVLPTGQTQFTPGMGTIGQFVVRIVPQMLTWK